MMRSAEPGPEGRGRTARGREPSSSVAVRGATVVVLTGLIAAACASEHMAAAGPPPACGATQEGAVVSGPAESSSLPDQPPLRLVEDVPLPGRAVRFDYQSIDTTTRRLYIAHMNAGTLLVFDTGARRVVAELQGFASVHGVLAVPELDKVFATATGDDDVPVVDERTLRIVARPGPVGYGDGLAYAPESGRVFVSDESRSGKELVLDAATDSVIGTVALGGEAGNTIYDPGSGCILVAVQTQNQVVAIDPGSDAIRGRYDLDGADHPHGLTVDPEHRLLFVANEGSASLLVVDLRSMSVLERDDVGRSPDVLAFDPGLGRLYVAAESGTVAVFQEHGRGLASLGRLEIPAAHSVAVDPTTHLVYLPLRSVGGRPVLRIMEPAL